MGSDSCSLLSGVSLTVSHVFSSVDIHDPFKTDKYSPLLTCNNTFFRKRVRAHDQEGKSLSVVC